MDIDGVKKYKIKTTIFQQATNQKKSSTKNESPIQRKAPVSFRVRAPRIETHTTIDQPQSKLTYLMRPKSSKKLDFWHRRLPATITAVVILVAFGLGMWVRQNTAPSTATTTSQLTNTTGNGVVASFGNAPTSSISSTITNDVLFNTPIQNLQSYFESPPATPDLTALRTEKLVQYLKSKGSPFAKVADTIAQQNHWKLILAIAFAESTLGKNCYYNNCSGIGGANIKTYDSVKSWITDFNGLLERRYKNKTLEQMCGVYVQPCNPNWLLATKEILQELKDKGIE